MTNSARFRQPAPSGSRLLLGGLTAAAAVALTPSSANAAPARKQGNRPVDDSALRAHIDTVVVIYAENRSSWISASFSSNGDPYGRRPVPSK